MGAVQHREHVALVLPRIGGPRHEGGTARVALHAGVVPGRHATGAEQGGGVGEHAEAHAPVAGDARVGGASGGVPGDEVLDHPAPEPLRHVEGEVRDAEGVGAGAGEPDGLGGAAGALRGGGGGVVPEAHRHADDVPAGVAEQHRGDGAVDAAAHRDRHPPRGERDPRVADPGGEPRLERAGDGVLHQLGAVAPGLAEAAEVGVDAPRREAQRVVERRPGQPGARGAGGRRRGAAAERLEPRLADAPAADPQVDPDEVTARRAAGLADGVRRRHRPRTGGRRQMAHRLGGVGGHAATLPRGFPGPADGLGWDGGGGPRPPGATGWRSPPGWTPCASSARRRRGGRRPCRRRPRSPGGGCPRRSGR